MRLDHREWDEIANSEAFTSEMDEIKDLEEENDHEKQVRLMKEATQKVDKIENKAEQNAGMYSVYQFFLAASILSFLLGVVEQGMAQGVIFEVVVFRRCTSTKGKS